MSIGNVRMPIFFASSVNPLSNFYRIAPYAVTTCGGTFTVSSSEQHFMALKAVHFGDTAAMASLRNPIEAKRAKAIGRKVRGYTDQAWHKRYKVDSPYTLAEDYMLEALRAKYANCPEYRAVIDANPDAEFVEASPWDAKWGIGMNAQQAAVTPREQWGSNWLGVAHRRLSNRQ